MGSKLLPEWWNWQTRCVQGAVGFGPWEFESPLRHHFLFRAVVLLCDPNLASSHTPSIPTLSRETPVWIPIAFTSRKV